MSTYSYGVDVVLGVDEQTPPKRDLIRDVLIGAVVLGAWWLGWNLLDHTFKVVRSRR